MQTWCISSGRPPAIFALLYRRLALPDGAKNKGYAHIQVANSTRSILAIPSFTDKYKYTRQMHMRRGRGAGAAAMLHQGG